MARRYGIRAVCALLLVLASASGSRADVVFPPPTACPPGAVPTTGHTGPYCAATTCTTVADCAMWERNVRAGISIVECAPAGLCVRDQETFAGRAGRIPIRVALGSCRSNGDCPEGIPCELAARCIAAGSVEGPVEASLWPRIAPPPTTSAAGCGAMGLVGLLVLGSLGAGLSVRRASVVRRDRLIRNALSERRVLRREDLTREHGPLDDRRLARALAPLAHQLRIEIDDEGETVYSIDDELERPTQRREG